MDKKTLLLALAILVIVIGSSLAAGWKPFGLGPHDGSTVLTRITEIVG